MSGSISRLLVFPCDTRALIWKTISGLKWAPFKYRWGKPFPLFSLREGKRWQASKSLHSLMLSLARKLFFWVYKVIMIFLWRCVCIFNPAAKQSKDIYRYSVELNRPKLALLVVNTKGIICKKKKNPTSFTTETKRHILEAEKCTKSPICQEPKATVD